MQPRKIQSDYEETESNRVSDFRDFVCSLFPKAILFSSPEPKAQGEVL